MPCLTQPSPPSISEIPTLSPSLKVSSATGRLDGNTTNWSSNTTNDISGTGNNAFIVSLATSTTPGAGKIGQGFHFNGSGGYVKSANNIGITGSATRTIAFWAKANVVGQESMVTLGRTCAGNDEFGAIIYNGDWFLNGCSAGNDYDTGVAADTKWHSHVITYDGLHAHWYLDGKEIGSGYTHTFATVDQELYIGIRPPISSDFFFNGIIDDVRVYNRALSVSEVQQLYHLGTANAGHSNAIISNGLVGYWPFDGSATNWSNNTTRDMSGSGNTGFITSSVLGTTSAPTGGVIGQAFNFPASASTWGVNALNSSSLAITRPDNY